MKGKIGFFILFLTFFWTSCDNNKILDKSASIPDSGWNQDTMVVFSVNITDTVNPYKFFINLRNNLNYQYSNFYLFLTTKLPNNKYTRDTIELMVADPAGHWLGKGFGHLRSQQVLIRRSLRFPAKGTYVFMIEQAMREKELIGIKDIGIRIEKEPALN